VNGAPLTFGLMAEISVQAQSKALFAHGVNSQLQIKDFADVFFERSAAIDALNPFVAEDFARINPRQVFEYDGQDA